MTQIEKIKAEIERLIKNPRLDEEYNPAYQCGLRDLRFFIESLEKKPKPNICPRCAYYQYDSCNYPGGGRNTLYNENGICECNMFESLGKEQEVDLKKEIVEMMAKQPFFIKAKDQIAFARHFYELGCRHAAVLYDDMEKERQRRCENEPTIKGWVARDSHNVKDKLYMFYEKPPIKAVDCYVPDKSTKGARLGQLPKELFPDLKWADEPIEVELTISRVKTE